MRYKSIEQLQPGDIVASDVTDSGKRIFLTRGSSLTENHIARLKQYGFPGLYIDDEVSMGIDVEDAISADLRTKAIESVREANINMSMYYAIQIMREIVRKKHVSLDMTVIRSDDDYTYSHSVSVTIISCVIGLSMKLDSKEMVDIAVAAILHDFGKLYLPPEIVNKPSRLTGEEYEVMKTHVYESYDLICDRTDISEEAKAAILMHHENEDGSGYPNGIAGPAISKIAKILHIADMYDALITSRPYKKGYAHWEAAEYLMGGCGILVDRDVVDCFVKTVPLYPKGTEVVLSNGDVCIILENMGIHNLRPVVRRITDLREYDLSDRENLSLTILSQTSDSLAETEAERRKMITALDKRKIMIVDDMKTNLLMMKEILESDYHLVLLKSGKQALSYLEKNKLVDLIIMDIDMPEMTGIDTVKCIKALYGSRYPILFVSSLSDKDTVLACRTLNANGYIVRPYQPVYIQAEIKRILEGAISY